MKTQAATVIQKYTRSTTAQRIDSKWERVQRETTGFVEKKGKFMAMSKYELVVWQDRFVYVDRKAGLCYQHVKLGPGGEFEPKGVVKTIPWDSFKVIKVLLHNQLLIQCKKRRYFLQLKQKEQCLQWL